VRQLEECQRVAVTLGDDPVADRGIERAVHFVQQQRTCLAVAEPFDGQLGQPGEYVVADARTRGAYERNPLGEDAATDESDDLGGGLIEPLRVVDNADERLLVGDQCEQCQGAQPHQEAIRRRPGRLAEYRRERLALRGGHLLEAVQQRRAELMEAAVGQLHLGLDTDGGRDTPAGNTVGQIAQEGALADAGLPAQNGDPTSTGENVGQEPVDCLAFGPPSEEVHRRPLCLRKTLRRRFYDPGG
jgi:hypothetical protein